MLFFPQEKDYKNVASGLRRELKNLGCDSLSHNQLLEAIAKGMGHKSYAALLAAQPGASAAPQAKPARKPFMTYAYDEEARHLAELEKYAAYRLSNKGELDLARDEDGQLVHGLSFNLMQSTLDDIWCCSASVNGARRDEDGSLTPEYGGDTKVNWDGQETRHDTRGYALWEDEDCTPYPEDTLIVVPEGFADEGGGDMANLLAEEVVQEHELAVREPLVDACHRWIRDSNLVAQALAELPWDAGFSGFEDAFYAHADAIGKPGDKNASVLGQAQWVAGFRMHLLEFVALRERLLAAAK